MYRKPPCPRFGEGRRWGPSMQFRLPLARPSSARKPLAPHRPHPAPLSQTRPGRGAPPLAASAAASRPFPVRPRPPGRAGCPGSPAVPRHPPAPLRSHLVPPPGLLLPPPALALTPALGRAAAPSPAGPPAAAAALAASREPAARGEEVRGERNPRPGPRPSPPRRLRHPGPLSRAAQAGRAAGIRLGAPRSAVRRVPAVPGRAPRTASGELGAESLAAGPSGAAMSRLAVLAPHGSWRSAGTPSSEVRGGTLLWGRRPSPAPFSAPGKWGRLPLCTENLLPAFCCALFPATWTWCGTEGARDLSLRRRQPSALPVPCCVVVRTCVTAHLLCSRQRAVYLHLKEKKCRKINNQCLLALLHYFSHPKANGDWDQLCLLGCSCSLHPKLISQAYI